MDSRKESSSVKNSFKIDCEIEKNRNYKGSPQQVSIGVGSDNVLTSTPNQSSSFGSSSGSRTRFMNSLSNSEFSQQANKLNDSICEGVKSTASSSQGQMCNRINTNSELTETTHSSGSRTSSSVNDNSTDSNQDLQPCLKYKACIDMPGNACGKPSTSGLSRGGDSVENNVFKENRKRPSSLMLKTPYSDEDSSSDTGNDDYSLGSEDGCIYTYRGGEHLADLPSSFFSLDMGLPLDKHLPIPPNYNVPQQGHNREQGSRASSPDMDFLEMDFDPGPSCEADTGDESSPDVELDAASNLPEEDEPVLRVTTPEYVPVAAARHNPIIVPVNVAMTSNDSHNVPSTSRSVTGQGDVAQSIHSYGPYITHVNNRGEQLLVRRTMSHWPVNMPISMHVSSGDLVSPRDMLNYEEDSESTLAHQINQGERPTFDSANLSSAFFHLTMAKKLIAEKTKSESEGRAMLGEISAEPSTSTTNVSAGCVDPPRSMVWSECEACERQVTQISTSACGATAVVNVFNALGVPVNLEKINSAVGTRQRANNAPLPRYILSRAIAGCTAADLVTGIHRASDGLVTARFFPTYPERAVSISHWLADWISLGAVPILTLNLQIGCEGEIPDAWHHQMVFGVSPRGVYLCNPVECIRENVLWPRLTSPSVLLVRTRDVLSRFTANTDLTPLMVVPDRRFHSFNVLGQVVNVIREWRVTGWVEQGTRTRHIRIPAAYQAGVTVSALTGSEAHRRLMLAAQLPILSPQIDPS